MNLFNETFNTLESMLNVLSARHTVIAGNVANVDTPGYKAKDLDFKEALDSAMTKSGIAMKRVSKKHLTGMTPGSSPYSFISKQVNNSTRNDGNNVNIDKEMVNLSQNGIMYDISIQVISRKFDILKYAISEGRRS